MTADQIQLPSYGDAEAQLDAVYAERFFSKMAEYGIQPNNEQDALAMIQTAYQLDQLPETKQASEGSDSPFVLAQQKLASFLSQNGVADATQVTQKQAADRSRAELAYALASSPELYKAAVAIHGEQDAS